MIKTCERKIIKVTYRPLCPSRRHWAHYAVWRIDLAASGTAAVLSSVCLLCEFLQHDTALVTLYIKKPNVLHPSTKLVLLLGKTSGYPFLVSSPTCDQVLLVIKSYSRSSPTRDQVLLAIKSYSCSSPTRVESYSCRAYSCPSPTRDQVLLVIKSYSCRVLLVIKSYSWSSPTCDQVLLMFKSYLWSSPTHVQVLLMFKSYSCPSPTRVQVILPIHVINRTLINVKCLLISDDRFQQRLTSFHHSSELKQISAAFNKFPPQPWAETDFSSV